jgi:hypothetical protein
LRFDAVASESTLFDCETEPSFPGLRTRIETFVLLGLVCAAPAAAPATCPLEADWFTVWLPTDGTAAVARPTPVVSERTAAMSAICHRFMRFLLLTVFEVAPGQAARARRVEGGELARALEP